MSSNRLDPRVLLRSMASGGGPVGALRALARYRRRVLVAAVLVFAATAAMVLSLFAVVFVSSPATVPVVIAGSVISEAAELFGGGGRNTMSGRELAEAAAGTEITCRPVPVESVAAGPLSEDPQLGPMPAAAMEPIAVAADGSVDRADAAALIDPVLPGTSSLTAHVWFLYRLGGLGDWDQFVAAYRANGFRDSDESPDAPLSQVQALNSAGVDMERYRLTAAALTAAGQYTGRLRDPYPGYRELVITELATRCFDDSKIENTAPVDVVRWCQRRGSAAPGAVPQPRGRSPLWSCPASTRRFGRRRSGTGLRCGSDP